MNIEINGLNKNITINLTDLYGKQVKSLKVIGGGQKKIIENIDLTGMGKGVYILNILGNEGNRSIKVVRY